MVVCPLTNGGFYRRLSLADAPLLLLPPEVVGLLSSYLPPQL